MRYKNKCHAHKPKKGKGHYDRSHNHVDTELLCDKIDEPQPDSCDEIKYQNLKIKY